jgi:hypothetical protein
MRDDIKDLSINDKKLAELSNLWVDFFDNPGYYLVNGAIFLDCFLAFLWLTSPKPPDILIIILILLSIVSLPLLIVLISWFKFKKWSSRPPLKGLLKDVKRFNSLIKSIHINDQLEEAGNLSVKLKDRERIIEALKLTREDLCRALKTERILRENKKFISRNPALFENNLIALTTLQVDDQASEQGRLLDEALQIALSTQEELRRFQKRDY